MTNDARQRYVEKVIAQLADSDMSDENRQSLVEWCKKLYDINVTKYDAVRILRNTEEYDPSIPEEVALKRINRIMSKYVI